MHCAALEATKGQILPEGNLTMCCELYEVFQSLIESKLFLVPYC